MKKVLVTGAAGFIGRHTLSPLLMAGFEVHALDRVVPPWAGDAATVHWHQVDLFQTESVAQLMAQVRPSHLLHLAWDATPGAYWTTAANLDWLAASLQLVSRFQQQGGQRVVVTGTSAEYDWDRGGIMQEHDAHLKPRGLYGVCKNALRLAGESFAAQHGLSWGWARLFCVYGPHERPERLIPRIICSCLRQQPVVMEAGTEQRDFMYVEDVAAALAALLAAEVSGAVNVASGVLSGIQAVVTQIAVELNAPHIVQWLPKRTARGEPEVLGADTQRLNQEVGWTPACDLRSGLERTCTWWRGALKPAS